MTHAAVTPTTVLPATPRDPDRDEARRLLERELQGGEYRLQESYLVRAWRWFTDLLPDVSWPAQLPPWATWVVLGVILLAALSVVAFAGRDRWRRARLADRRPAGAVLEGTRRSAADYRAAAARALDSGDSTAAVLEGYRAVAATAIERTVLDDRPGSTAHEVAVGLGPAFPAQAPDLLWAADRFDAARYGGRRPTEDEARRLLRLDERLLATAPQLGRPVPASGAPR